MTKIRLQDVSLEFPIFDRKTRSLKHTVFQTSRIGGRIDTTSHAAPVVRALDGITLEIKDGQRVAILGGNGAGKSSLLRIVSGALPPAFGQVEINGSISSLINIQLGIDEEATGIENIVLRGLSLGFTKREILARMDKISEFSELGPYLEAPVRTYSQGMRLRLALAVVLHIDPDILLLDEWIGVSDARFASRVRPAVRDFVQRSSVLLLATHNIELAKNFCSHGIILEQGTLQAYGPIDEIIEQYGSVDLKVLKDRAS